MIVAATRMTRTPFEIAHADRPVHGTLGRHAIRSYVTQIEAATRRDFLFRRLPETSVHVFVVHGPAQGEPRLVVVGPRSRTGPVEEPSWTAIVGVELRAGAGRSVLGVPMGELLDRVVLLEDLWGPAARELLARLEGACDDGQRERRLLSALAARAANSPPDATAVDAVVTLEDYGGWLSVGDLAGRFGLSVRQLHRRFVDEVGMGPKRCARIARIRRIFARPWTNGAEAAAELGFVDQAHLIDEFRDLVGVSPGRFFATEDYVESTVDIGWLVTPRPAAQAKAAQGM